MQGDHEGGPQSSLAAGLAKGALAGIVATFVLDRVDWFLYRREPEASRRRTAAVRPQGKDPAHVIATRASQAFGGPDIPHGHPAGLAVHYAIGIAPAAMYGVLRERVPAVSAGAGLAFGAAVSVLEDEAINPAFGFSAPPQAYPWQAHARGFVSHLVYGLTTELVLRALDTHPRRRPGNVHWMDRPGPRPPAQWRGGPVI